MLETTGILGRSSENMRGISHSVGWVGGRGSAIIIGTANDHCRRMGTDRGMWGIHFALHHVDLGSGIR